MAEDETQEINGRIQLDDYGSIRDGDTEPILSNEELDEDSTGVNLKPSPFQYDPLKEKGNFFRDGIRKIDFMLVYIEENEISDIESKENKKEKKHQNWRTKFIANVAKAGIEKEEELVESGKSTIVYIKLRCPWETLCIYAEELSMRAPLQAQPNPNKDWSGRALKTLHIPNMMSEDVPNKPLDFYTCTFKRSKIDRFLGSDNHETYFPNRDRQRIAYEIIATAPYGKRKRAEIGIERLLEEDVFSAAFPLHDGPWEVPEGEYAPESLNPRQVLLRYWARWGKWYKYQPLDHIRDYFGEKIGIYFAWLGFYTAWLLPASIVGLLVFLYGVFTMHSYIPSQEFCESGETFKMCPLCDEEIGCQYWYLSSVCMYSKIAYLFDHPGTVFFAIFVSFWAVTFLEYWERKCASLSHHWDCMEFAEEEERPRPEYQAMAPTMERNPITGIKEPHFPSSSRLPRMLSGVAIIIIMIVIVIIFIVAVIMYRVIVSIPLFQDQTLRPYASTMSSLTAAIVNLILIMALAQVYQKLALKLTQWEMHRTQTEFENQLIFKVFLFQFINFYSSIIYVGFFKGKFVGYPGHYTRFFGLRNEECQNGGCLIELAMQLVVIMIGKQSINNCQEVIVPKLKAFLHHWKIRDAMKNDEKARWEEDYELIENEGLFDEYLEMVLQFGFITIFVCAFPIAPLFALINNWVEIRLDAQKFVCETRRPVAERTQDIGVWFDILDGLAQLAVISNALLIAFTSEFLPRILYQYSTGNWELQGYVNFTLAWSPEGTVKEPCRYQEYRDHNGDLTLYYWTLLSLRLGFVILFEHFVFGICKLIDLLVPDVPESLQVKVKRERFLAKQALADTDAILQIAHANTTEDEEPKA